MSNHLLTVHQAAEWLGLHPKTVLRYIHDGRLHATRIGKSYRIQAADLDAFSGPDKAQTIETGAAQVTAMIEIAPIALAESERMATVLSAVLVGRKGQGSPVSLGTSYEPAEQRLKIMLRAEAGDAAALLQIIEAQRENVR